MLKLLRKSKSKSFQPQKLLLNFVLTCLQIFFHKTFKGLPVFLIISSKYHFRLQTEKKSLCQLVLNFKNFEKSTMSRIERKYCLISTSYLSGLLDIFILLHIWQNCACVCVLVTFYQWGHFMMLAIRNLNLISVQSILDISGKVTCFYFAAKMVSMSLGLRITRQRWE